jgi:Zn-dependent alcohol dehydrogenase
VPLLGSRRFPAADPLKVGVAALGGCAGSPSPIGIVEAVGSEVRTLKAGDVVVMPFASFDDTCAFCHEGLTISCVHVGFFGNGGDMDGGRGAARVWRES